MALQGNKGQLLVKVTGRPFASLFAGPQPFSLRGYVLEPLAPSVQTLTRFNAAIPSDHWLLATPENTTEGASPWDAAHAAAQAHGYEHYVEPDIIHEQPSGPPKPALRHAPEEARAAATGEGPPQGKLDDLPATEWPPHVSADDGISPGWHLSSAYAGFETVRNISTGVGVRIAHLDTGYTPNHASTPRNIRHALAYDFWAGKEGAIDPGTQSPVDQPGHGTSTLALLAGNAMDLRFGKQRYVGDIGGAPDAEIVPIRISPSVIHIATSTMAQGLYYALAPSGDPRKPAPANRCDVVTISHGGLPTATWADAVNTLYEAGIVIVAASGDSIYLKVIDLATRFTVYPSAFNRVLTAVGATYAKLPYVTDKLFVMQGCWGPDAVMEKALAGFTPNVVGMRYDDVPDGFDMDFGGTSASTPQIAAACALWLQLYRNRLPDNWSRVEACRLAMFDSADDTHPDKSKLGWGLLNVPTSLSETTATKAIAAAKAGKPSAPDSVSFPFWRLLLGIAPPDSEEERMYKTEVAQVVLGSDNTELRVAGVKAASRTTLSARERQHYLQLLRQEPKSKALESRIAKL